LDQSDDFNKYPYIKPLFKKILLKYMPDNFKRMVVGEKFDSKPLNKHMIKFISQIKMPYNFSELISGIQEKVQSVCFDYNVNIKIDLNLWLQNLYNAATAKWKKPLIKEIIDIPAFLKKNEMELHDKYYAELKKYVNYIQLLINTDKFDIGWLQEAMAKKKNYYLHYLVGIIFESLAYAWNQKQFFAKARGCFNQAIEANQNFMLALYGRSSLLMREFRDYKDALKDCNRAIKINPNFTLAYILRGDLHEKLGKVELAFDDFNKIIEIADDNNNKALGFLGRANCWKLRQKFVLALRDFRQVKKIGAGKYVSTAMFHVLSLFESKRWEIFQQSIDLQREFLQQSSNQNNQNISAELEKMQSEHKENFPLLSFMRWVFFYYIGYIQIKKFNFSEDLFCQETLLGLCRLKFVITLRNRSNECVPYFKPLLGKIISKYMSESLGGLVSRDKFDLSVLDKFVAKFIMEIKKHHKFVDIYSPVLKQMSGVFIKYGAKLNLKKWLLGLQNYRQENQKDEEAKQQREDILAELFAQEKKLDNSKKRGGKKPKRKKRRGRKSKNKKTINKKEKTMKIIPLRKLPAPKSLNLRAGRFPVKVYNQPSLLVGMFKKTNKTLSCDEPKINTSPYATLIPEVVRYVMNITESKPNKSKLRGGAYLWLWDKLIDRSKISIMPEPDDWDLTSSLDLNKVLKILISQNEFKLKITNNIDALHAHLIIEYTSKKGQLIKIDNKK
jgi:tetratricopeptide (TPR) repeat protein